MRAEKPGPTRAFMVMRHWLTCDYQPCEMRHLRTSWVHWRPAGYAALFATAAVSCWWSTSLLTLRFTLTVVSVTAAGWFARWRSADRKARRCERAHADIRCAACGHYGCDGEWCGFCEGPCKTRPARVLRVPRPRQDAHWLN